MVPPDSPVPPTGQLEESASDIASTLLTFDEFSIPSSPGSGPHYYETSLCSALVNQADFDPMGTQDHSSAFSASNLSFDSNNSDAAITPLDLFQGHIPWTGIEYGLAPAFTEDPVSIYIVARAPGST